MSDWLTDSRSRDDTIRIPTIWLAGALSVVLHALVLWAWAPEIATLLADRPDTDKPPEPLVVQIAPERKPRGTPAPAVPQPPQAQAQASRGLPPKPAARPPSPPRAVPFNRPEPYRPPPVPVPAPPAAPPAPPADDLAAYIEARRRARGETPAPAVREEPAPAPPQPVETEEQRRQRIIASNLGLDRTPSFGGERRTGGGVFQIERIGYSEAEFTFFGWNKDIRRNSRQRIVVQKGDNPDINIAIVRRMIQIIRQHEQGDFTWVSYRLGRDVTLSARPADTAGLEEFLMREFFVVPR